MRESGGLGVTLGDSTLTFFVGATAYATVDVTGGEAWVNITLPASSSLESNPITAIDDNATQVPDTVQIVLKYVDFNQKAVARRRRPRQCQRRSRERIDDGPDEGPRRRRAMPTR